MFLIEFKYFKDYLNDFKIKIIHLSFFVEFKQNKKKIFKYYSIKTIFLNASWCDQKL